MLKKIEYPKPTLPFTPENALAIVARERKLEASEYEASFDDDERQIISIRPKDSDESAEHVVNTIEHSISVDLNMIRMFVEEGKILEELNELSEDKLISILLELADPEDLKPWVVANTRSHVCRLRIGDLGEFWKLWKMSGLKPFHDKIEGPRDEHFESSLDGDVIPSYSLVKDLSEYEVAANLKDPKDSVCSLHEFEGREDLDLIDILLSQCKYDVDALSRALYDEIGGIEGFSGDRIVREGFVLQSNS